MNQTYWIIEYVKLFLAYGFVLFVWPSVVFRPHLKGKGGAYRFAFCTTVTVLVVTTAVLLMGLAHILHTWTSALVFFGVFAVQLWRNFKWDMSWIGNMRRVSAHTMTLKQLIFRVFRWFGRKVRLCMDFLVEWSRGRRVELLLLLLLVIFGTIYFSYNAFDTHAYGSGDQYVHNEWIYKLKQGVAFSDGIYPEGMHCMIYLTCSCFGIRLYTGVLFFGCVHSAILLLSFYLFMREIFRFRYSGLLALCMFLTLKLTNLDAIFGMARLSWALPLEYAMHTQFFSALALLRFYRRVSEGYRLRLSFRHPLKNIAAIFRDPDLFIFTMSIAVSIAVHFYVTITAFFICLAVAVVSLRYVFRRGSFGPVLLSAFLSLFLAVTPMAVAFATGVPLQGSLNWAISVITGGDEEDAEESVDDEPEGVDTSTISDVSEDTSKTPQKRPSGAPAPSGEEPAQAGLMDRLLSAAAALKDKVGSFFGILYNSGLLLFPRHKLFIAIAFLFTLLVGGILHFYLHFKAKKRKEEEEGEGKSRTWSFDGILTVALSMLFFALVCASADLHLPTLLEPVRVSSTMNLLMMMLYTFPLDLALFALAGILGVIVRKVLLTALVFGIYIFAQVSGEFHGYLFYHFMRYDAAVTMTNKIIQKIPKDMFTIVSTTEELYQIIEYGYHEELLTFINNSSDPAYTLPTPYVFVFIEKRPLSYAQYHFAAGPAWLARECYAESFGSIASQCPEINAGEISLEDAAKGVKYGAKLSDAAADLEGRTILESKIYYNWYETFSSIYPNESRVVYEDDDFLCYCFVQNPASLYTLGGIEYSS